MVPVLYSNGECVVVHRIKLRLPDHHDQTTDFAVEFGANS